LEGCRLQKVEHTIIHRWTLNIHEVIDQCVTTAPIRMEEPARQIEAGGGEVRL
jgi:hypothetical protein